MSHLDLPLRVTSAGVLATVTADSAPDIANSLGVLMATRPGERLSVPGYGSPDPLFSGVDAGAVQATVEAWEPRADLNELDVVVNRDGSVDVTMNVGG